MAKYYLSRAKLLYPFHEVAAGSAELTLGPAIKSLVHDTDADSLVVTLANGERWPVPWNNVRGGLYASEKPAK